MSGDLTLIIRIESFRALRDVTSSFFRLRKLSCVVIFLVTVETGDMTQVLAGVTGSAEGSKIFLSLLVIPCFFSF